MGGLKRAKKFQKNHLSAELKHRKNVKKHNQLKSRGSGRASSDASSAAPSSKVSEKFDVKKLPEMAGLSESESENGGSGSEAGSDDDSDMDAAALARDSQDYLAGDEELSGDEQLDLGEEDDSTKSQLTKATISEWAKEMKTSYKPIRSTIRALAAEETITDLAVLDSLLKVALNNLPEAITKSFPLNNNNVPVQSKRIVEFAGVFKFYARWLAQTLAQGRSQRTNEILHAIHLCLPYFLSFRKDLKELLTRVSSIVVNTEASDVVKMNAFSVIRDSCIKYPSSLLETFIKINYELLLKLFANTNAFTQPSISLAKNLFASLYSIEPSTGYQNAFKQVRQLALSLKMALDRQKNPKVATEVIYTWQYMHSLDFFSRVISLSAEKPKSPLLELIHPLVQVTLRTATLLPSSVYFPYRFHLVRSLIRLSRHTSVYIPLFPVVLEVLESSAINKRGKKSSLKQFDFTNNIHVSQNYVDTAVHQKDLSDEVVDLIAELVYLNVKSIAFPELAGPVAVQLKRYISRGSNAHLNRQLQNTLDRIKKHREFIVRERESSNIGPKDHGKILAFLSEQDPLKTPLGEFIVVRRKIVEERRKASEAARSADGEDDEDDEEMESDSE